MLPRVADCDKIRREEKSMSTDCSQILNIIACATVTVHTLLFQAWLLVIELLHSHCSLLCLRAYRVGALSVDGRRLSVRLPVCAVSNRLGVGRGPKFFQGRWGPDPLGCGRAGPLEICFSPFKLSCQFRSFYVKLYERNDGRRSARKL